MFTAHMVGLMYFDACGDEARRVLLPNGTKGGYGLPQHYASIWIEANRYDSDDWWPNDKYAHDLEVVDSSGRKKKVFVLEFRIPEPATVTFPDSSESSTDTSGIDRKLPSLQSMEFVLDPVAPDAIVTMPIRGGSLAPFGFGSKKTGVVQWAIAKHPDRMTITARSAKNPKVVRSIVLRRFSEVMQSPTLGLNAFGIEVVLTNTQRLVETVGVARYGRYEGHKDEGHDPGSADHNGHSHFTLYGRLDVDRKTENLENPKLPPYDQPLRFDHGLLRHLAYKEEYPHEQCSGSCC